MRLPTWAELDLKVQRSVFQATIYEARGKLVPTLRSAQAQSRHLPALSQGHISGRPPSGRRSRCAHVHRKAEPAFRLGSTQAHMVPSSVCFLPGPAFSSEVKISFILSCFVLAEIWCQTATLPKASYQTPLSAMGWLIGAQLSICGSGQGPFKLERDPAPGHRK